MRRMIVLLAAMLAAVSAGPARALEPATTGIVLMHGKWGAASHLQALTDSLREAGFLVDRPEMPWSGKRLFDRGFDAAMEEIDQAADRLRAQGAARIVVAGHSLGGNGAFSYAARGRPVVAAVLVAPAHFPEGRVVAEKAADSIAKARAMVASGQGGDSAGFVSFNDGDRNRPIQAKAADYLSYYGADGPAAMSAWAPSAGTLPMLWLAPSLDRTQPVFAALVVPKLPPTARLDKIEIVSSHMDAADLGRARIVEWLLRLP